MTDTSRTARPGLKERQPFALLCSSPYQPTPCQMIRTFLSSGPIRENSLPRKAPFARSGASLPPPPPPRLSEAMGWLDGPPVTPAGARKKGSMM